MSALLAAFLLAFAVASSSRPLIDQHSWRQTQTAITVFYILQGGPWLDYITPVLGAPWRLTLEAPIYQLTVALFARLLPVELSGRLVSALYSLGAIAFACRFLNLVSPKRSATPALFVALSLAAPLHLFFGRAFLIESCALFFGAAYLYFGAKYYDTGAIRQLVYCTFGGILCALAKSTTWPAFAMTLGLYVVLQAAQLRQIYLLRLLGILIGGSAILLSTLLWTSYADALKMPSTLGSLLTSSALREYVFGTTAQRFGRRLWFWLMQERILPDVLGTVWLVAAIPIAYMLIWQTSRRRLVFLMIAVCFLFPMFVFTNLHLVHNYYQMANALFVLMALAVALGGLFDRGHTAIALTMTVVLVAGQLHYFKDNYWSLAFGQNEDDQVVNAARWVRDRSPTDTAMLAFGIDYSAVAHYYAERKGIAFPPWAPAEALTAVVNDLPRNLGGLTLGAIIDCRAMGKPVRKYREIDELQFNELIQRFRSQPGVAERTFGKCTSLVTNGKDASNR